MSDTGKKLLRIFRDNWKEDFIFDAINDQIYTYENFFKKIIEYRENLVKLGLKKNDQIVVIMNNSIDVFTLYFAALFEGISIVSIDPLKGKEETLEILSRVKYKKIFSNISELDFEEIEKVGNFKTKKFEADCLDLTDIFTKIDYDSLFIITFTSGSTGKSKGVMHSFNNFVYSSENFSKRFGFNKTHKFFHNLPMSYIGGILNLLILPLISESKIIISHRFDISKIINFWREPIKYSANTFWFPPTIIALLLKLDRGDAGANYSKKNKIIGLVGMAALKENVKKEFEKKYEIQLFESYALSETFFLSTNFPENDKVGTTGKLLEDVKIEFSQEQEILIDVPWMFLGYLGLKNDEFFVASKYISGDIGRIDYEGYLQLTGRKKDLIIKGGINISPKKIEDFLSKFDFLEESIVIGAEDEILGEKIVCFYITNNSSLDNDVIKEINRDIVKNVGIEYNIEEFVRIDEIPRNLNGKIDRPKMREIYQNLK